MATVILNKETLCVNIKNKTLELTRYTPDHLGFDKKTSIQVPFWDIDRVIVEGRPTMTINVLQKLMFEGIPVSFITSKNQWIGNLSPDNNKNAARRIMQYQKSNDNDFNKILVEKLIIAKIKNSKRVIQRLSANRDQTHLFIQELAVDKLNDFIKKIKSADSIDEIRGFEGIASAVYFNRLADFFPKEIPFEKRSRRPPLNAANALLSWTYTIVQSEIDCAIRKHGLDSCIGFMHAIAHGTPSLTVDLLETLRAPLCDMLTLHIFNHKIMNIESFRFNSDDGGTYLIDDVKKTFFFQYENYMQRQFTLKKGEPHTDFRKIIENQVLTFIKALEGDFNNNFFIMP